MIFKTTSKTEYVLNNDVELQLFIARTAEIFEKYKFEFVTSEGECINKTRKEIENTTKILIDLLLGDHECNEISTSRITIKITRFPEENTFSLEYYLTIT